MRRLVTLIAAIALIGVLAPSASAARFDAADFEADCRDDGNVVVSGTHRYIGGTVSVRGTCIVSLEDGAKLVFRDVDISADGSIVATGGADARIRVIDSTISVGGALQLTAGCCSGEGDGSEANARVVVRRSSLTATNVQLMSSFDDPNGRVIVRRSTINATMGDIQLRASDLGGTNGLVRLKDSSLSATGDLLVRTGTDGKTVVVRNRTRIDGTAEVSTGVDGRCRSRWNLPELPCGAAEEPPADDGESRGERPTEGEGEGDAGGEQPTEGEGDGNAGGDTGEGGDGRVEEPEGGSF